MKRIFAIFRLLQRLMETNLLMTMRVNFKMLPFAQAVKFPIFIYGSFKLRGDSGRIEINAPIATGMIKVGRHDRYLATSKPLTVWNLNGRLEFDGKINFFQSSYILVAKNAHLTFGKGTLGNGYEPACGGNLHVICFGNIVVEDAHLAWDCQIIDSSFHYLKNVGKDDDVLPLTKPIYIGNHVWIGNRTTIMGGARIPDETIVASHSMVNKDFSENGSFCLLAGIPATVKRQGVRRIYDKKEEARFDEFFHYDRTRL